MNMHNGIISYKEYIATLNDATKAQAEYANIIRNAPSLSPNTAYSNEKNIEQSLLDMGMSQEQVANTFSSLESSVSENAGLDSNAVGEFVGEKALAPLLESAIENQTWIGKQAENLMENRPSDGSIYAAAGGSAAGFLLDAGLGAMELKQATVDAEAAFVSLYGMTGNYNESLEISKQLTDQNSLAYRVYNDVLGESKNEMAALNATIAAINNQGSSSPLNSEKYSGAFAQGFGNKQMNPDMYAKLFSADQTAEQVEKQLRYASGNISYREQVGPGGERESRIIQGGGLNEKQKAEYANAMGSIAEIVGPEMQDKLTEYVAAGIRNGSVDGGTEGITQLQEMLGDQEAVNMYIDFALEDGKLEAGELKEIAEQLAYIKTEIPPDMRLLFGIDIENPEHFDKLSDPAIVDQLRLVGETIEGLPEEERKLAASFAFDIDENGQPKTPREFIKGWKQIQKLIDGMDEQDLDTRRTTLIEVITKLNGEDADPAAVNGAVDTLIETYGAGVVANLPPTVLTTAVEVQMDASQAVAVSGAKLMYAQSLPDSPGKDAVVKEAQAEYDAALALQKSVGDIINPNVWNGGGSSGGGGGGGGDKSWLDTLAEDYKKSNDVADNLKELAAYNNKQAKDINKLNEETMQYLAEDEKAMEQFRSGKYSAKEINKMYFSNMKKGERQQTKEMRTQNRREDLVDNNNNLDYFTKEQIKADAELLELYEKGGKEREFAIAQGKKRADQETTILDRYERQVDLQQQQNSLYKEGLDLAILRAEQNAENDVLKDGKDRAQMEQENAEWAAKIKVLEMEQIKPKQDLIEEEKNYIKELEREYQVNEDNIDALKDQVDERKRMVEDMQRALELRQREGEMLDHDLKLMGYVEEEINKVYDERIEALNKVADINQQIAQSQKDQLGLADALSRGDIGAAALAAQQMQQNQMQFASEQYQGQLETNRDNAIASLTGAESGLTREQIEMRKRELEEDSYQTNLKIRAVEDEIYNLNRQIRDENDIIAGYKDKIETHNKTIRDLEWDIHLAQTGEIKNLKDMVFENDKRLAQADYAVAKAARNDKIQLARFERNEKIWEAETSFRINQGKLAEQLGIVLKANNEQMQTSVKLANEYWKAMKTGKGVVEKIPSLSSVTWGEFEFSKTDISKMNDSLRNATARYGEATATYGVPTTAVPQAAVNGIMGSVTNNFNNNNVNVNAASANAHEVAQIVLREINWMEGRNVK